MEIDVIQHGINWILGTSYGPYIIALWGILGALVTIASFIAPFTTTVKDDEAVSWVKALIHRFTVISPKIANGK